MFSAGRSLRNGDVTCIVINLKNSLMETIKNFLPHLRPACALQTERRMHHSKTIIYVYYNYVYKNMD
jgi:hypothetical protein